MSPFFRTRKSVPNLSAANRNRLMALLNAPSTVFASPQPACRIPPPKKASSYRGCRSSKTGYPSRESRSPTPSAMAVSCMGRSRATDILSILPPILTGSPVSLIPARSVLPAMSPGSAWEGAQPECFAPDGLGGEMTEGKAAPPSPLRRPAEGVQGLEQAMARHAGDCDRAGGCRRIHAKRRALSHLACFLAVMPSCPILR